MECHLISDLGKMKIHERLRALRNAKGITQEYVAHQLSIDPANYGRMERGESRLTVDRLEQVLQVLEVSTERFFIETNNDGQPFNGSAQHQVQLMQDLLKEMTELKAILTNTQTIK